MYSEKTEPGKCSGREQGNTHAVCPDPVSVNRVHVIGLGLSREDLTLKHLRIITGADFLVGGRRHLDYFPDYDGDKQVITRDIAGVIREIKTRMPTEKIVVLASGDPLFYGIGSTLVRHLGRENLVIHPNISSPAAAFAAMGEPWEDARLISFHGRMAENFDALVQENDKMAILTDAGHTPAWIADHLVAGNLDDFTFHVFECMGTDAEKRHSFDQVAEVSGLSFAMPNIVVLKRKDTGSTDADEASSLPAGRCARGTGKGRTADTAGTAAEARETTVFPGMPEALFSHENGLITKSEVRSVVLSKLRLDADDYTFWDLGAGSGSVSIEVSRFLPRGQLFAVEKNTKRIPHITRNVEKFGVSNLTVVHKDLPAGLADLPAPDRVFVGGGGKNLAQILEIAGERLSARGILVVNTVLLQTMHLAVETLKGMGFTTQFSQIQVSVSRPMPFGERLEALNPVWVITAEKTGEVL